MIPKTFDLVPCEQEIEACQWMSLNEVSQAQQTSAITQRALQLIRVGLRDGFGEVALNCEQYKSLYKGLTFKVYNRQLPVDLAGISPDYPHDIAEGDPKKKLLG